MRQVALLLLPLALLGCQDDPITPRTPTGAEADILDDAHGGDTHFYFLTPTVAEAPQFSGTFNPDIWAIVEVCQLAADGTCGAVVATFTREGEPYYARIRVTEGRREQYIVYWNTSEGSLSVDKTYRVRVLSGSTELGHVDVDLVASSAEAAGVDTDEFTPVVLGNWLPIRFRIEKGALCGVDVDCFEGLVTPAGDTLTVPSGFAGVFIPPGAVDAPVNIIIERVAIDEATGPCLPTAMQQVEGCYLYDTDPALSAVQASGLDQFNTEVAVGACIDPAALDAPEHHQYLLHKFDPDKPDAGVVPLPSTAAPFVDCANFVVASAAQPDGFFELAVAGWKAVTGPLARVLAPTELQAINRGFGGIAISFSRVGWARALQMTIVSGDGQTGTAGSTLPLQPTVQVTAVHFDPQQFSAPPPVAGIPVTFTFRDPAGNQTSTTTVTDQNGMASLPWTLGSTAGLNTLAVSGPTIFSTAFAATATNAISIPRSIVAGARFSCSLNQQGQAFCWGAGSALGVGDVILSSPSPVAVTGGHTFVDISGAGGSVCGLTAEGNVYCWGVRLQPNLNTSPSPVFQPEPLPGGILFDQIDVGWTHACGIARDGAAYCWGDNDRGQLGNGTIIGGATPVAVAGGVQFASIDAGFWHSCGIDGKGIAYCWGGTGGLGSPSNGDVLTPAAISSQLRFKQIRGGALYTCGITVSDAAWCWGVNYSGQLGDGTIAVRNLPVQISDLSTYQSISATPENSFLLHTCGISTTDRVRCWGLNDFGQLGTDTQDVCDFGTASFPCSLVSVAVGGIAADLGFTEVDTGHSHTCAIGNDGRVYCWGRNDDGQLGDGTTTDRSRPTLVHGPLAIVLP